MVHRLPIRPLAVAPGLLIALLQRGLQYHILEQHLDEQGQERPCTRPWSLLQEHTCDDPPMVDVVGGGGGIGGNDDDDPLGMMNEGVPLGSNGNAGAPPPRNKKGSRKREGEELLATAGGGKKSKAPNSNNSKKTKIKEETDMIETVVGNEMTRNETMDTEAKLAKGNDTTGIQAMKSEVSIAPVLSRHELMGHGGEILALAWHAKGLISCASDDTARLWQDDTAKTILPHPPQTDVTCVDCSPHDPRLVVTGCSDGKARLWTLPGDDDDNDEAAPSPLILGEHAGAILAVRWDPSGELIATAGVDHALKVYRKASDGHWSLLQSYAIHQGSCLSVAWRGGGESSAFPLPGSMMDEGEKRPASLLLASCSSDRTILILDPHQADPIARLQGHEDEVNALAWLPDGTLASCSDDGTVRLWTEEGGGEGAMMVESDSTMPAGEWRELRVLRGHTAEVYTIRLHDNREGERRPWLASAGFDGTVRLWDPLTGECLRTWSCHTQPVYSLAFHPRRPWLATGALDGQAYLHHLPSNNHDGSQLLQREEGVGVLELAWSPDGSSLAMGTSQGQVRLLRF